MIFNARERVNRGAQFLDRHDTDWWRDVVTYVYPYRVAIDRDALDMADSQNCVLGLRYTTYTRGLDALALSRTDQLQMGFDLPWWFTTSCPRRAAQRYRELTDAWLWELDTRRYDSCSGG